MAERTLVVHATNLLTKGYMSTSPDRTTDGEAPTGGLFVAVRALLRALAFKQPDVAVAVVEEGRAFDDPILARQHARLPALLEAHGIPVVEARAPADVVAAYVTAALEGGDDVVVVGSDKRLAQLVGERAWWYDAYKDVRYTPELVRKRFGVLPPVVAGWLALVGDDDTLPGVKGIGKKGATDLIEAFGSVDAALDDLEAVGGRTGKALRASSREAITEVARAKLDHTAALPRPLGELAFSPADDETLQELYRQLGFVELLSSDDAGATMPVTVCTTDEEITRALTTLGDRPIAMQALHEDPSAARGDLVGLALACDETEGFYVPVGDSAGTNSGVPEALVAFLGDADRPKTGHDTKDVVVAFARRGITVEGIVGDSACASHLHEPSNLAPQDLSVIAPHVLGHAVPEPDELRGVGRRRKPWGRVPRDDAGRFAARLAGASAAVWDAFSPTTDRALLREYLDLSRTLSRMELHGIAVDGEDLAQAGEDFTRINEEIETEIFELAGKSFNINSTKQLGTVLYEDLELPIVKRTKTGWSTATDALERIEHAHPIVAMVIRWRRLRRLTDSWVTALRAAIDSDGRVRSTFSPARSFTGRLVNSSPDLGRVPGQTPEMVRIRHAFHAPPGYTMVSVDYEQLGLYVLAHLTADPQLVEPLRAGADMHRLTGAAVLELPPEALDDDQRQLGKLVNFATFAGQGASALALQLGVTAKEAKEFIARFDRHYHVVRAFQDEQLRLATERGYIETIAGRRWPIGDLRSNDRMIASYAERLARRATHEASVADVTRRGLLHADRALRAAGLDAMPLLQVHDEVLFEVREDQVEQATKLASDAFREAYDLRVPLRVGSKVGPNWAELVPVEGQRFSVPRGTETAER